MSSAQFRRLEAVSQAHVDAGVLSGVHMLVARKGKIAWQARLGSRDREVKDTMPAATTGAVMLVRASAAEWQSEVAREVTIQVRPMQGRDLDAEVRRAAEIARAHGGRIDVRSTHAETCFTFTMPTHAGASGA